MRAYNWDTMASDAENRKNACKRLLNSKPLKQFEVEDIVFILQIDAIYMECLKGMSDQQRWMLVDAIEKAEKRYKEPLISCQEQIRSVAKIIGAKFTL